MNHPEEEKLIRLYLLSLASDDQQQQVEERLLGDSNYCDQLVILEEELIDDYLLGVLPAEERNRFESHFLTTPKRKWKLALARDLKKHAANMQQTVITHAPQSTGWWQALLFPRWKPAAFTTGATAMLAIAISVWQFTARHSPVNDALAALDQAYREARPIESRVTGFGYAPFTTSVQRGPGEDRANQKVDYIALERAKALLFGSDFNRSSPAGQHALGKYFLAQKEFDKAIDQFRAAATSDPNNAQVHSDLGAALLGKIEQDRHTPEGRQDQDLNSCLIHLNRALELDRSLLEPLFNRALLYQREQLGRQAREDWNRYLQKDSNSPWADEARRNLNAVEEELKKVTLQPEHLYQNFLSALQDGDDVKALNAFNLSYSFNGNYIVGKLVDGYLEAKLSDQSNQAENCIRALTYIGELIEKKSGDRHTVEVAYLYRRSPPVGLLLLKQARNAMIEAYGLIKEARNDPAIEKYDRAKRLFEQAGDKAEALLAEAQIGFCHHQRSDTDHNLEIFTRLVPEFEKRNYLWTQALALCGLANANNSSGLFSQAINNCRRCGEISARAGDQAGIIRSQFTLANFYYEIGKHKENLRISQEGRNLAIKTSANLSTLIQFYNLPAWSLSALGYHESALAFQKEAVEIAKESRFERLIAYAQIYQGAIYARYKRFNEAIASTQRGIAVGKELKDDETGSDIVHTGLLKLGHIYREASRLNEALEAFDQVINFFQRSKKQAYLYGASKGRLMTLIAQGNDRDAKGEIEKVIALYEQYRKSIQEESNRNNFFDQEQDIYDIAIDFAHSNLNDPQKAFEYVESCRARSLLDESKRTYKVIKGVETPDLQIVGATNPIGTEEIRQQMPEGVQLIEYAVLEDKLIIWLISSEGIESQVVKISQAKLTELTNTLLSHISRPPSNPDEKLKLLASDLHDLLIKPIESQMDGTKQICVIPDKMLARLPFGALISRQSGKFLVEEYSLIGASSANMFLRLTERAREKSGEKNERLFAVGNPRFDRKAFPGLPDLPTAAKEVSDIAAFYYPNSVVTGIQARKSIVLREIERADVVHLAMHYVTDQDSPMFSKLPFADTAGDEQDDVMQLYELYQIRSALPRLVVLSACRTRAEEYFAGEGAVGVSRPWEAAGVPLVIASLWPVDTRATTNLMTIFHRERTRQGITTAEALRSAQVNLLRSTNYNHPYYWAAFTITGGYSEF